MEPFWAGSPRKTWQNRPTEGVHAPASTRRAETQRLPRSCQLHEHTAKAAILEARGLRRRISKASGPSLGPVLTDSQSSTVSVKPSWLPASGRARRRPADVLVMKDRPRAPNMPPLRSALRCRAGTLKTTLPHCQLRGAEGWGRQAVCLSVRPVPAP